MYIFALILPLFNFIIISLLGFFIGRSGSCFISVFGLFLSFLCSILIFFEVTINQIPTTIKLYNWICIDIYSIHFGLLFDSISSVMLIVITFISLVVHLYSITYLGEDPYLSRFMSYLSLFTFFMLLLVTSDNFVQLFIGWEGVGLCSYLLINFWFTRLLANKAAIKAMIMNRIADVFFLIAIVFILLKFKTTDFTIVFSLLPFITSDLHFFLFKSFSSIELISFFLLIGAFGKSAQIGFHTWLPDAMEGPTPVSALLHAATMVTAGVFLVIRSSLFFEFSDTILTIFILVGCISTFFAGFVAIFQYDIKKIIAYSTCSQLGYMFIACGLSNYHLALFHLFNHAFFKALLFLSAGAIIHAFFDEQDMRKYGGNVMLLLPFTYTCFLIGSLAIMGFPYLTGFFSKELIIELGYNRFIIDSIFCYTFCIFSALFTSIYSCKLWYYSFIIRSINSYKSSYKLFSYINVETHDFMFISMTLLAILSLFLGFLANDLFIGLGTPIWLNSLPGLPLDHKLLNYTFLPFFIKDLPLSFGLIGIFLLWILFIQNNLNNFSIIKSLSSLPLYFNISNIGFNGFFFNNLYNYIFISSYNLFYIINVKYLDKGVFELFGPFGIYNFSKYILNRCQSFFFHTIYYSLFIQFFFTLNILIITFFFFLDISCLYNIGLLFLLTTINLFTPDTSINYSNCK